MFGYIESNRKQQISTLRPSIQENEERTLIFLFSHHFHQVLDVRPTFNRSISAISILDLDENLDF